jgi:hypothetical protein
MTNRDTKEGMMQAKILPLAAAISIVFLSGCMNSATMFYRSTATYQNSNLADIYTLSFYLPNDTEVGKYDKKITEFDIFDAINFSSN